MNDKNLTRGCVLLRAWLAESPSRTQASLAEDFFDPLDRDWVAHQFILVLSVN